MKALALLLCVLPGPAFAAIITTITCPTPAAYIGFVQDFKGYVATMQSWTTPPTRSSLSTMMGAYMQKYQCNEDHSPGYVVTDQADFDGTMFVDIHNKFYSGWMNKNDFQKLYLEGTPQ